jgi:pimeloyl-ACP methyl ester carboxylesterase
MVVAKLIVGDLECTYEDDYFGEPWIADPPVVLMQHGFNGNRATFQKWVPELASRYRVIRRALIAHDGTTGGRPDHDLSLDGLANDLVAFLDALEVEAVHFLGTHTGAMSGLPLAVSHPDRVRSLGLLDCPIQTSGLQSLLVQGLPEDLRSKYATWSEAIRALGGYQAWYEVVRAGDDPADPLRAWQRQAIGRCDDEGMERYVAAMHHFDTRSYLDHVTVPTLIVAQTGSRLTSLDDQLLMRVKIPNAELSFVEDRDGGAETRGSQRGSEVRIVEMAPSEPGIAARYAAFLSSHFPAD